jgi:hypothetical protein
MVRIFVPPGDVPLIVRKAPFSAAATFARHNGAPDDDS